VRVLSAHKKPISSLAFSSGGALLAEAAHGGTARVWDVAAGQVTHTFETVGRFPKQVRLDFSPDGATLAVVNEKAELIDLATGTRTELPTRAARFSPFNGICYSPDGRRVAAGGDRFYWWLAESRKSILKPHLPLPSGVGVDAWRCFAFSPDGARLAAGWSGTVHGVAGSVNRVFVHDIAAVELVTFFEWNGQEPRVLMFSPDGKTLAAACGAVLRAWDIEAGNELAAAKVGVKHLMDAAMSPDGRFVATVSKDRTARLWGTQTWADPKTFDWDIGELLAVAYAPDGQTVAVGSHRGKVLLFDTH
jgi:WD40 repeat protein